MDHILLPQPSRHDQTEVALYESHFSTAHHGKPTRTGTVSPLSPSDTFAESNEWLHLRKDLAVFIQSRLFFGVLDA